MFAGPAVNRLVLAGCAVAAFAVTWVGLQQEAPGREGRAGGAPEAAVSGAAPSAVTGAAAGVVTGAAAEELAAGVVTGAAAADAAFDRIGPGPAAVRNIEELFADFDADLGEEGVAVDRARVERALRADAELRHSLGLP